MILQDYSKRPLDYASSGSLVLGPLRCTSIGATREINSYLKPGLLSNQVEKSINFYFIRVPLRKEVLKYGTPKPRNRYLVDYASSESWTVLKSMFEGLETRAEDAVLFP